MALHIVERLESPTQTATVLRGKAQKRIEEAEQMGFSGIKAACRERPFIIGSDLIELARTHVSPPQQAALESLFHIQRKVALRQYETLRPCILEPTTGVKISQDIHPLQSVAIVAPGNWDNHVPHELGGLLVAASVAGVSRRVVLLEPDAAGGVSPISILSAGMGEATEIFRAGGIPGLVGLLAGWFGPVPEKIVIAGNNRLVRAAWEILLGVRSLPKYDLMVLTDSTSGVQPLLDIFAHWLTDDPYSNAALLTTSRRLVSRLDEQLQALPTPKAPWTHDMERVPIVVLSTMEELVTVSAQHHVRYLVLMVSKPDLYISRLKHADHIVVGDHAAALVSRRIFAAGGIRAGDSIDSDEISGVFSFLRSQTVEKMSHKAAERLRVQLSLVTKL